MTKTLASPQQMNAIDQKVQSVQPKMFKVFMLNDNYTTMEFVIEVLQSVFHKEDAEATSLMLQIHRQGQALCGLYPFEIAETKVAKVHSLARVAGFPLRCILEPN
ncbi:MAG: ATP-dependent Clp protease adaptor ClpS [Desulfuromonadales bacterium]|nr:ATP-dependent Clp protease adaptor ClpS [Desulfuromonadales bacterium]